MRRIGVALVLAVAVMTAAVAQAAQKSAFEVSSVKLNTTGRGTLMEIPPTGRVKISSATLRTLVTLAYHVRDFQIIGGPDWINADRFDVQARPSEDYQPQPGIPCIRADCPPSPVEIMMQGLLEDRFRLKIHRETRELPVYELTIAKSGFKLKEVSAPPPRAPGDAPPQIPPPPRPGTAPPANPAALPTPPPGVTMGFPFGFAASGVQFAVLDSLLSEILGRPVVDKTGIKGDYDFKIVYSRDGLPGNGPVPPPPGADGGPNASDPRPSIFTALQEVLGLKLESSKGPVEVLVIDSVQRPSEN